MDPGEYPYKTYAKTKTLESASTALTDLGYGAEALHNNGGNFYSRAQVFNHMGFDHFTSKEFMNILQTTPNGWATDDILVPNIMESMDTTEGQDFCLYDQCAGTWRISDREKDRGIRRSSSAVWKMKANAMLRSTTKYGRMRWMRLRANSFRQ